MSSARVTPRVAVASLGCRLNHAEADLMRQQLHQAGLKVVDWDTKADIRVLNSCCITAQAEAKTRKKLRQARHQPAGGASQTQPDKRAMVVVTGCHAQLKGVSLWQDGLADLVVGNGDKSLLAQKLTEWLAAGKPNSQPQKAPPIKRQAFSVGGFDPSTLNISDELTRAHLKIQDGCHFGCSFCIIPQTRGGGRPRQWPDILQEAELRATSGTQELVLSGVNLGSYQCGPKGLVQLVDALDKLSGITRIRISSIEPTTVNWGLLERMADPQHKLTPFLHLPLQSGSGRILKLMRRRYTPLAYYRFADRACQYVPDLCLGTDVMVGFPSESSLDFQETISFIHSLPFAYLHIFPFSPRPRTLAARMSPVPAAEKRHRVSLMHQLGLACQQKFLQQHQGRTMKVLFERPSKPQQIQGYTANYVRVAISHPEPQQLHNCTRPVKLLTLTRHHLIGQLIKQQNSTEGSPSLPPAHSELIHPHPLRPTPPFKVPTPRLRYKALKNPALHPTVP